MKPVCVVSCPIDTFSGYGHRSRDFVRSLIKAKDKEWDIAFNGTNVKLNSGSNGPGDARAANLYLYGGFFISEGFNFQRIAEESFGPRGERFFNQNFDVRRAAYGLPTGQPRAIFESDWFKKKEKTIGDSPEYKGWLKLYVKNKDVAAMHKNHKEFLQFYQQSQKNEELDFGKMWSTFMHGPKDDFPKYLEFAQSKMNYLPDDRIRKRLKMKFPKIMPVDVERVIKKVQVLRANRT